MTETQEGDIGQWLEWGKELAQNNFRDEAIECFKMAIALPQRSEDDLIFQGQAYAALGDHWNAIMLFDEALDRDSTSAEAWNQRGVFLENAGCETEINPRLGWDKAKIYYETALRYYEKAIELNQNYADAWNNKGISLYRLRRYNEALSCFGEVISLDPNSGDPWYNKSIVHDTMEARSEATTDMAQAITLGLSP